MHVTMSPFAMVCGAVPTVLRHVAELERAKVSVSPLEPVGVVQAQAVPIPTPLAGANSKSGIEDVD